MHRIFKIASEQEFNDISMVIFQYQHRRNTVYRDFINNLGIDPQNIKHYSQIPFLPIEFFKTHKVVSGVNNHEVEFHSSGTSELNVSKHYVVDISLYEKRFINGFTGFYGDPSQFTILALLPSYLEQGNSSLVYMADKLIQLSGNNKSGFYLNQSEELLNLISKNPQKTILLGVTYALLDLAENYPVDIPDLIVMETGGMKGRRKEIVREEVHSFLKKKLNLKQIHSEYGMTELLSQAYSKGDNMFKSPPWMKVDKFDDDQTFVIEAY
ncbi:MAG: acyltransferase [Bacteroidales bacterium]